MKVPWSKDWPGGSWKLSQAAEDLAASLRFVHEGDFSAAEAETVSAFRWFCKAIGDLKI